MKVEQFENKNQFVIYDGSVTVFQSYNSVICEYDSSTQRLKLFSDLWDYSNTTRKHFKLFVNEHTPFLYTDKAQWLKMIKDNERITVQE